MLSKNIIASSDKNAASSTVAAVRLAIKEHAKDAQAVHIIIASVIKTRKTWKTVTKVIREPDAEKNPDDAIIFCHLPQKYNDLYDDLLDEVDHLNLIDDESIWDNITAYLLDIIFYQAVNFNPLEPIKESGGGYLKETSKKQQENPDTEALMIDFDKNNPDARSQTNQIFGSNFYTAVETEKIREFRWEEQHYRKKRNEMNKGLLRELKKTS